MRGLFVGGDMVILFFSDPAVSATTQNIPEIYTFFRFFKRKTLFFFQTLPFIIASPGLEINDVNHNQSSIYFSPVGRLEEKVEILNSVKTARVDFILRFSIILHAEFENTIVFIVIFF